MPLRFIKPHPDFVKSYVMAVQNGLDLHPPSEAEMRKIQIDFDGWWHDINDLDQPVVLPDSSQTKRIPQTLLWLVSGNDHFIGRIGIRHYLNDCLRSFGGHIGYAVRTSERRKGYGYMLLGEGLKLLSSMNVDRALVTCNDDNIGSAKIIEKAGGVLEKTAPCAAINGELLRHYWIYL